MHAASILNLLLDFDGWQLRVVLIVDLVDLIFKKLVIVATLVVDAAANDQNYFDYDGFDG